MSSNADDLPLRPSTDRRFLDIYEEANSDAAETMEFLSPAFAAIQGCEARYRDDTLLGQGALKDVYRTYDHLTRRWVAMARLREGRGLRFYDSFVHEAWLVSSLSHPNIIKVHDVGLDDNGHPFFTMDLKGDAHFANVLDDAQAHDLSELLEVFIKVCDAIAYAHAQGVIHLDLKPENIQCDSFGEVLVCDWGLGKRLSNEVDEGEENKLFEGVSEPSEIKGSPGFMAPEQVDPDAETDGRTDVYALGCILYTILCGEPAHVGTRDEVLQATLKSPITSLRERFPERQIPASLDAVVLKATARRPSERYASVVLLRQDIHKYLGGYATGAEQSGFFREARLFTLRNRIPVAITVLAFMLLVVVSVLFVQHLGREQIATQEERSRANRLLSEVNELSLEYDSLFEESKLSRKELANKLAASANGMKNLGVYDRPVEAVVQAERLVDMALSLNPQCRPARWQLFRLNCLKLNFAGALRGTTKRDAWYGTDLYRIAQKFPDFAYGAKDRPSPEVLAGFFRALPDFETMTFGYLERMFAYNYDASRATRGNQLPFIEFLKLVNGRPDRFTFNYNFKKKSLSVESDQDLIFKGKWKGGSGRSLLRFLRLNSLRLSTNGSLDLSGLNMLDVVYLDLSACERLHLEKRMTLPQLNTLIIPRGQALADDLKSLIRSNQPFEIVESAEADVETPLSL